MHWLSLLVFAYLLWLGIGCAIQRSVIYPRHITQPRPEAADRVPGLVRHWLETDSGRTEIWFAPAPGAEAGQPAPAAIFCHGNGELIEDQLDLLQGYRKLGISVLMCEYRGYGRSSGSPSQKTITTDQVRAYDWLIARPEVDPKRVFFHGRSLGSGVACALAAERKPAALILQAPFRSVRVMMRSFLIFGPFVLDPYDNEEVVRNLDRPLLVLHGREDEIVPFAHGQALAAIGRDATLVEFDCGHNDFPVGGRRHWEAVEAFLKKSGVLGH